MMTKKWKCPSITPSQRWTTSAEEVTRPNEAASARVLRPSEVMLANIAAKATITAFVALATTPAPCAMPKKKSPSAWSQSTVTIQ